jgi:hypothetical protein
MDTRELHVSSNGDKWYLCRDSRGKVLVAHEPNNASGGKSSLIELSAFLQPKNQGPEHQALRSLISDLVEKNAGTASSDTTA